MSKALRSPSPFGVELRRWRLRAGMSQMDLALAADTTPRHVSFLETGRSRPGRELLLRLAAVLDVPLRDRNAMLAAAGLAPAFPVRALDEASMRPIHLVLERALLAHEPYPAWVVAGGLRFIAANRAAEALFPGMCALAPQDIVDMWFGPGPYRDLVENWQDVVWAGIGALRREAMRTSDPAIAALLHRAERLSRDVPPPLDGAPELPVACPRLRFGGRVVRTISAVMRFDTAIEVTASDLEVEMMFPADDESDAFFREAAAR